MESDKKTHDYALSVEELFKKSDHIGAAAGILEQISDNSAEEESYKALYFGFLGTLKNHFQHPYDATIFKAEELAAKNDFAKANDMLLDVLRKYVGM